MESRVKNMKKFFNKIDFKDLFKEAFRAVWKNPVLWLFGFFAVLFANNEIKLLITNFNRINNWIDQLITFRVVKERLQQTFSIFNFKQTSDPTVVYYLILILVILFLFFYLSLLAQIFIISSVKKKSSILDLWKKNQKFVWPVTCVYFITLFTTYGFLYFLSLPLFYQIPIPIIVYIVLFLTLSFFLSFVARFVIFYIILNGEKFFTAIKKGFLFFFKNWSITIKICAFLFLIVILFGLGLFLIFLGAAFPLWFILLGFLTYLKISLSLLTIIIFLITVLGVLFAILGSMFSAFQFYVWALLFLKFHKE